jgi:hypothetical protein
MKIGERDGKIEKIMHSLIVFLRKLNIIVDLEDLCLGPLTLTVRWDSLITLAD